MKLNENCKGCYMLSSFSEGCLITQMYTEGWIDSYDCICFDCLVKVMCRNVCKESNLYFSLLTRLRSEAREEGNTKINQEMLK